MTPEEIIEMARHIATTLGSRMCDENGDTHGEELYAMGIDDIVDTIKLVAEKEREACAEVCDDIHAEHEVKGVFSTYAEAIRARGENK